jgi:hypothetical protein
MRAKSGMSIANIDFNGSTAQTADSVSVAAVGRQIGRAKLADVATGLCVAAFLPALFWTALVWAVGHGLGVTMSGATLATVGFGVAAFLTIVCSAMFKAD